MQLSSNHGFDIKERWVKYDCVNIVKKVYNRHSA